MNDEKYLNTQITKEDLQTIKQVLTWASDKFGVLLPDDIPDAMNVLKIRIALCKISLELQKTENN
jgi:hypothetical protein